MTIMFEETPTTLEATSARLKTRTSEVMDMCIADIRIDLRFQRHVNPAAVARIRDHYHPAGMGLLLVAGIPSTNPEESRFVACIDGQTRLRALQQIQQEIEDGIRPSDGFTPTIRVEAFAELTSDEAALLFRLRNQQWTVPVSERDRIAVTEGNPIMIQVVEEAGAAGYTPFSDDPDEVTLKKNAMAGAKRIVVWGQKFRVSNLLQRTLEVQARAFESEEVGLIGTIHPQILQATAWLIAKNPHLMEEELIRVMAQIGQSGIMDMAERRASAEGKTPQTATRMVLVERYNKLKKPADRIGR